MSDIIITIECDDDRDLEWVRTKSVIAVESAIETAKEEGRLDGRVELIGWEIED